ncbi:unnamed protein product [Prorocentrum cordatum]|uniref:Uncharacterized protein n=1 Tax=Prorocentrum cordatum TaxID=2364126 RepID=A0ABN9WBR6_9DINO|nr:unnamed protein product [Polarella glacialis]
MASAADDSRQDHGRQGRLWQRLEETERSEGMGARLKGRVQAAVRQVSENLSMPRGPLTGSTPPPKSRKKEEDDMDDVGPEMNKLAGVLTRRLGDMIAEKFEERDLRLRVVEEKVEGVAKATDEAIGSLEDKFEALHKEVEERADAFSLEPDARSVRLLPKPAEPPSLLQVPAAADEHCKTMMQLGIAYSM